MKTLEEAVAALKSKEAELRSLRASEIRDLGQRVKWGLNDVADADEKEVDMMQPLRLAEQDLYRIIENYRAVLGKVRERLRVVELLRDEGN